MVMVYAPAVIGPITPQGRLCLATGAAVPTAALLAKTVVFYTPYKGNVVPIYNGSAWLNRLFAELSNDLTASATGKAGPAAATTNSNYDLFVWDNAGTLALTRGPAWTSGTARGSGAGTTQLSYQNGILVNTVAITNGPGAGLGTYVGTFTTDGSSQTNFQPGAAASGGTAAIIGYWNCYNRMICIPSVLDGAADYTYTSATIRAWGNSNGNRITCIRGLNEDMVEIRLACGVTTVSAAANAYAAIHVLLDSTTTVTPPPASRDGVVFTRSIAAIEGTALAYYVGLPGLGLHYFQAGQEGDGANANTFRGSLSGNFQYEILTGMLYF